MAFQGYRFQLLGQVVTCELAVLMLLRLKAFLLSISQQPLVIYRAEVAVQELWVPVLVPCVLEVVEVVVVVPSQDQSMEQVLEQVLELV